MRQVLTLFLTVFLFGAAVGFAYFGIIHATIVTALVGIVVGIIHIFSLIAEAGENRKKVYKNAFKSQYVSEKDTW